MINECVTLPETTTRVITTTLTPNIEGMCRGIMSGNIPYPQGCVLFIYCYQEEEFIRQCPQFHIFDRVTARFEFSSKLEKFSENILLAVNLETKALASFTLRTL